MDYDKTEIPITYDQARALVPETRRLWQNLLSAHIDRAKMSLVIDLGCGTGRFSELLAAHFGVQVIGVDPSLKMLDQARRKSTIGDVVYCQGSAEALPLQHAGVPHVGGIANPAAVFNPLCRVGTARFDR